MRKAGFFLIAWFIWCEFFGLVALGISAHCAIFGGCKIIRHDTKAEQPTGDMEKGGGE